MEDKRNKLPKIIKLNAKLKNAYFRIVKIIQFLFYEMSSSVVSSPTPPIAEPHLVWNILSLAS